MIPLKKSEMQVTEISSKLKGQRSKSYRNQPLSAFSFRLSALMQRSRLGFFSGIIIGFLLLAITALPVLAKEKEKVALLIGEPGSYKASQGISEAVKIPEVDERYDFYLYTAKDLKEEKIDNEIIAQSAIFLVDTMYPEITDYALKNANFKNTKVYSVREKADAAKTETGEIVFDPYLKEYYSPPSKKNIKNLLLFLLNRDFHLKVSFEEPVMLPEKGFFHPRASKIFDTFDTYLSWYKEQGFYKKDGFWVGVADYSSYANPGDTCKVVSALISSLEENSINVLPGFAYPSRPEDLFFNDEGKNRVDVICGLCFKMSATATDETPKKFMKLDVPVLNPGRVWRTIPEWRVSPQGLSPTEISVPEFNGLIEPSVLGGKVAIRDERTGKEVYEHRPIRENIEFLVRRIKAWRNLQVKANKDKRIAIIYWNHTPGKHNVGASYLNVFRSLEGILKRMRDGGYTIRGNLPSEEEIKELVLKSGRNIGSWVPGELDELINTKRVIQLQVSKYLEWYRDINEDYRKKMEEQWGRPEESKIMVKDKKIIIPYVNLGNIILLPQPSRGWGDDPMKLYHSPTVWPHHQYTAFYLWLKHEFKADAIVSLGKHGTHEWLPGKQAGLSQSCPPEVLIQDLPNIYPYIVDNIGEGIQAKRRGRGVIIDHLIPPLRKAGAYQEYRELAVLIDEYNAAIPRSNELAKEKLKRIKILVKKLGLDKDLLLTEIDEEAVEEIEHYVLELQEANVPYGLHTYGVSPQAEALEELSRLIKERNEEIPLSEIKGKLSLCHLEMDRLIAGLEGRYIPSGEGNDPLRNPQAIPTGRNFYGFDPAKVPSKDAYSLGKKQAEEMIQKHLKEEGEYPDKIGLILWATELHRNEGTQVGTALYLLGMKPVWDKNSKVTGVEPIPGAILGRPRIDVHLQASGLFRDSFPNVMILLDEAVRQASQLKDVENFIAKHSRKIKAYLIERGYSEEEAEELSHTRVFSEAPGSYVIKVQELVPNSGLWESDEEIADVFIQHASYAYGKKSWGVPLKGIYKKSLEDVKVTMHTRSSNLFGVMDNDDVFAYLGGLSLGVKRVSGEYPDVLISDQQNPEAAHIEDIERTIGEELRARYLNPKWIEGMKKEDYAGAREMDKFVEYMWGWQVTTPFAIDRAKWEQTYEVYVEDKYGLEIKEFFNEANPWAYQSITARMLEAVRKGYWKADEKVKKKLAVEYAVNVIEKGVACCHHTCNNPFLNQMVVNIISLPGIMSPEMAERFKLAIEQAMGKELAEQVEARKKLQKKLNEGFTKKPRSADQKVSKARSERQKEVSKAEEQSEIIEGYKMEEVKTKDETTELSSSGVQWLASLFVILILGLVVFGVKKYR
jgi:cobaltochelatase CobN